MKKPAIFLLSLGLVLAACAPTTVNNGPTPDILATLVASTMQAVTPLAPPPTSMVISVPSSVTMPGTAFAFQNISMSIPLGFSNGAHGETVPALESSDAPIWEIAPQHTLITLDEYILGKRFHEPQVFVYPVDQFAALNESAAGMIEQLRSILDDNSPTFPETLPHLPIFNAQQMFHAQVKKIDFGSGRGIRYITQYSQAYVPVNNNELFYTFQGLTADGKYYVAANLPIVTPLIDTMSAPNFNDPNFSPDQFGTYVQGVAKTLNSLAPAFFSPTLDVYDQFIMSVVISQ